MLRTKLVIIGGGPAGYTAAIYAARADLRPTLFAGPEPGGQLMLTSEVENFPGFPKGILGPELMQSMREQAQRFGTTIHDLAVISVDLRAMPYRVRAGDENYTAESIIIATGATAQWLGLPNEQRLRGKGVSACATCDGFFFRGKDVAVVGGGDSAMEEAVYLTKFAKTVTVLVRRDQLRASKAMIHRAESNPKITIRYQVAVSDVLGDASVVGLLVDNIANGMQETLDVQGLFLAIGHRPSTELFRDSLEVDQKGYLVVHDQVLTSKPGVFVAGDVADYRYRQAITAAGWGCMAALEAERFLAHHE